MTKKQRILRKAYKNGDDISLVDIIYGDKHHIDKIIYGRLWIIRKIMRLKR